MRSLARFHDALSRVAGSSAALRASVTLSHLVGESPLFLAALEKLPQIAVGEATVLITGETGTGKGEYAKAIHYLSPRSRSPFAALNCGAIPGELVENELFGHVAGAFTSASTNAVGIIRPADGGTLFLDEVDSLSLGAQSKILRFLESHAFRPVGGAREQTSDVRIVAASNADLPQAVREGRFRKDLFFRLNVVPVTLPPLRDRPEDIGLLAEHFLKTEAARSGRPKLTLTPRVVECLQGHSWPGNVRELGNVIQHAILTCKEEALQVSDLVLPAEVVRPPVRSWRDRKAEAVEKFEKETLHHLLRVTQGNVSWAARLAAKHPRAMFELLHKHGLSGAAFRGRNGPEPGGCWGREGV